MQNTEKQKNIAQQKIKLEQKKNRLIAEETKLKLKERRMRTRHLIEVGGLIVKAGLDHLPTNTLYGALLSLSSSLERDASIKDEWTKLGKMEFDREQKNKHPVILKFNKQPDSELRQIIRNHGLKWNRVRQEWYGEILNIDDLKNNLGSVKYELEQL
jgi:hypothetical protein